MPKYQNALPASERIRKTTIEGVDLFLSPDQEKKLRETLFTYPANNLGSEDPDRDMILAIAHQVMRRRSAESVPSQRVQTTDESQHRARLVNNLLGRIKGLETKKQSWSDYFKGKK